MNIFSLESDSSLEKYNVKIELNQGILEINAKVLINETKLEVSNLECKCLPKEVEDVKRILQEKINAFFLNNQSLPSSQIIIELDPTEKVKSLKPIIILLDKLNFIVDSLSIPEDRLITSGYNRKFGFILDSTFFNDIAKLKEYCYDKRYALAIKESSRIINLLDKSEKLNIYDIPGSIYQFIHNCDDLAPIFDTVTYLLETNILTDNTNLTNFKLCIIRIHELLNLLAEQEISQINKTKESRSKIHENITALKEGGFYLNNFYLNKPEIISSMFILIKEIVNRCCKLFNIQLDKDITFETRIKNDCYPDKSLFDVLSDIEVFVNEQNTESLSKSLNELNYYLLIMQILSKIFL